MQGRGKESLVAFLAEHPGWRVIDYSQLNLWEACARKYEYEHVKRLQRLEYAPPLFSTLLIHAPLSQWYLTDGNYSPIASEWHDKWQEFIGVVSAPLGPRQEGIYTLNNAVACFRAYCDRFRLDFTTYVVESSEEIYWRVLPGIDGVVWLAKPDLVLKRIADEAVVTNDFKFSAWDFQENLLEFDRQFLSQAYVTGAEFMMKNFIRADNRGRVMINREFEPVAVDQLEEWLLETCQNVRHMLNDIETGVYPKRAPGACYAYKRECEYKQLCTLGKSRGFAIDNLDTRNPLEYLGL